MPAEAMASMRRIAAIIVDMPAKAGVLAAIPPWRDQASLANGERLLGKLFPSAHT